MNKFGKHLQSLFRNDQSNYDTPVRYLDKVEGEEEAYGIFIKCLIGQLRPEILGLLLNGIPSLSEFKCPQCGKNMRISGSHFICCGKSTRLDVMFSGRRRV